MKNPEKTRSKNRSRNLCEKVRMGGDRCSRRGPPGTLQFNKTPPEETYINRKKTKRRCPTCKKSKEGTNNLQKYQTDDQRKVIYEGNLPKGDLQKVIYEGKPQKSDLQKEIYEGKLQKR